MFLRIKIRIEKELINYVKNVDKFYSLKKLSPVLFKSIKEFILREGKRIRPILFCIGYLSFSKKNPPGLYRSALSLELLHDFMLVHDDIIDKSNMRRGKPSMHTLLQNYLAKEKNPKFDSKDLAIVVGDVMYAMALDAFLAVKEDKTRKELALKKLISAALYTGSGEFIELLLGIKPIEKVLKQDIYKIYDFKTANYTFAYPLTMGASLAGANPGQIRTLHSFGILLGRAFQIKDDIMGTFGSEDVIGKSNLSDIREAKRTLLIWYAYNHASQKEKLAIKQIFESNSAQATELHKIRRIITETGSLEYAQKQIKNLFLKALAQVENLSIEDKYKDALREFSQRIFKINLIK